MSTSLRDKPWDLSHVLDLVNTLTRPEQAAGQDTSYTSSLLANHDSSDEAHDSGIGEDIAIKDFVKPAGLGNFAKIWQYIGVPAVEERHDDDNPYDGMFKIEDYASDGATYTKPSAKKARTVTWQDQASADDLTGGSATDTSVSPETPKLTKSQRKKQNRRERKAQGAAAQGKSAVVSESEADVLTTKTPAKKASVHNIAAELSRRYNLRESTTNATAASKSANNTPVQSAPPVTPKRVKSEVLAVKMKENITITPQPNAPLLRHYSQPATTTPVKQSQSTAHYGQYNQEKATWESSTPAKPIAARLVPASVQPPRKTAPNTFSQPQPILQSTAQQAVQAVQAAMQNGSPNVTPSKKSNIIEPKIIRSGDDRNWALFLRLLNEHAEERKHLVAPMNMMTHNNDPNGIHVFVDASNIFIGFNDQLKRERGMPAYWHTTNANLSFDALALLMERRRPVAKRVLVGSTPSVSAFDTARAVGYEVSLLDKVYKARELTERQIYFRDLDASRSSGSKRVKALAPPTASHHRSSSGSETTGAAGTSPPNSTPQFAPAKMIEQGVDEILHLKILESIVDSETPSTMVIATGDAAQAEYSQGFMAMAERAMKKGWKVELVSWSKNISQMYMRREFRERWAERFKVVFLDNYAEELLDM
jgi:hypothetical protein